MLRAQSIRSFIVATGCFLFSTTQAIAQPSFDIDADGTSDYFVGYPLVSDGLPVVGTVRIYSGATLEPIHTLQGGAPDDLFGLRVDCAGDTNSDGFDDILVSAIGATLDGPASGRVYVFSGSTGQLLLSVHGNDYNLLGRDICPIGDINGDGSADFAASGFSLDSTGIRTGFVRLFSGSDGSALATLSGRPGDASFGAAVTGLGDLDNDGAQDLAVSAPHAIEQSDRTGAVYIFRGKPSLPNTFPSITAAGADATIWSFSDASVIDYGVSIFAGKDENTDGVQEVVVASRAQDEYGNPELRYESVDIVALEIAQSGSSLGGGAGGKLVGDQNGDLTVDIDDLILALTLVTPDADPLDPFSGDLDRDGDVDGDDLVIVSQNFGSVDALTTLTPPGSNVGRVFLASGTPTIGELECETPGALWGGIVSPGPVDPSGIPFNGFCCESPFGPLFQGQFWYPIWTPITDPEQICNGDIVFYGPTDGGSGPGTTITRRQLVTLGIILNNADGHDTSNGGPEEARNHDSVFDEVSDPFDPGSVPSLPHPDQSPLPPNYMSSNASLAAEHRSGHDTRGPNQMTTCPVLISDGVKTERDVDLNVQLPGEDFVLKRVYNGGRIQERPSFPWIIGRGWGASVDGWVKYKPGYDNATGPSYNIQGDELEVIAFPLEHSSRFFRNDSTPELFDPLGPSDAFVFEDNLTVAGHTYPVWIVESSGEGQTAYFRTAGDPELFDLDGRILQKRDAFGNKWTYRYVVFQADYDVPLYPFVHEIYLHGDTRANAKAVVTFQWDLTPEGPGDIATGRVRRIEVERPYRGSWITTQYAEYTYSLDNPLAYGHLSPMAVNVVLVERGQLLNAPLERSIEPYNIANGIFHKTFTHFRYQSTDARLTHVFEAEQIEFFAERWAHDVGLNDPEEALRDACEVLMSTLTDGTLPSMPGTKAEDLASKIIEYYPTPTMSYGYDDIGGRVKYEYLQNGCACSPNGGHSTRLSYEYRRTAVLGPAFEIGSFVLPTEQVQELTQITEEIRDEATGNWNTNKITRHYSHEELFRFVKTQLGPHSWVAEIIPVPFVVANCIIDGADPSREHWSYHHFENHQDVRSYMPDAIASVQTDANDFLVFTTHPVEAFTFRENDGLVEWRTFDDLGRQTESGIQRGESGISHTLTEVSYPTVPPGGRTDLPERTIRHTGNASVETTDYTYITTPVPGSVRERVVQMSESMPLESTSDLGPGGSASRHMGYTPEGLMAWEMDETGSINRTSYESLTGSTRRAIRNDAVSINAPGVPSTNRFVDGGMLFTDAVHDIMGRPRTIVDEAGLGTHYLYGLEPVTTDFDDDGLDTMRSSALDYLTVTTVPHVLTAPNNSRTAIAPVTKQWASAELNLLRSSGYLLDSASVTTVGVVPIVTGWAPGEETSRTIHRYDLSSLLDESRTWHDLGRNALYRDRFEYDALGRLAREIRADGGVTETTYDYEGRVKSVSIGNEDTIALSEQYFYDHTLNGSTPQDGVGNGHLTLKRLHIGNGGTRDEVTVFDWRGRERLMYLSSNLAQNLAISGSYEAVTLDLLDRPIETASIGGGDLSTVIEAIHDDSFDSLEQLLGSVPMQAFTRNTYGPRGLVTRSESAVNPLIAQTGYLQTRYVYDEMGREIAMLSPSGPVTKRAFDGIGREWAMAVTAGEGLRTGIPHSLATHPFSTTDSIFEVTSTFFDSRGLPELSTVIRKANDGPGLGPDPITTAAATMYDDAARPIASIDYGVALPSGADLFASGGAPPFTAPSTLPERTPELRITETRYDERGRAYESIDAEARVTRTFYDDLDRAIAIAQNYTPPTNGDLEFSWSPTLDIYTVTNRPSLDPDENRVTSTVYDASGREMRRVAHLPNGANDKHQISEFIYDPREATLTSLGNLSPAIGPMYELRYPNQLTGEPSEANQDIVRFAYNLAGEQITTKDQKGIVRAFDRDGAGRLVADRVVGSLPGETIDTVQALVTEYDTFGRSQRLRSATVSGGTVNASSVNELIYSYTPLGQVASLTQVPSPTASPLTVSLEWETLDVNAGNEDRRRATIYPNNTRIDRSYGAPGSANDLADRVAGLTHTDPASINGAQSLVEYDYMGLASVSRAHLAMPDLRMDRRLHRNGTSTSSAYPGWDRFGRLKLHSWVRDSLTQHATDPDAPSEPPLLQESYVYDQNSNRLAKTDARFGAAVPNTDWRFSYDRLDRLRTADRGKEEAPQADGFFAPAPGSRAWELDAMGNWDAVSTDHDGDGQFNGVADRVETRAHNMTNEFVDADRHTGDGSLATDAKTVRSHDHNGNLTQVLFEDDSGVTTGGWRYRYDAWNRLSAIDRWVAGTWQNVAINEYCVLHWRVRELLDASALIQGNIPDGVLERERLFAYSPEWQLLYESRDTDRGQFHTADLTTEYIWGTRSTDDAIARRVNPTPSSAPGDEDWTFMITDGLFSVVAELDIDGNLRRRITYDAYGKPTFHWPLDLNRDGLVDGADTACLTDCTSAGLPISITDENYNADADLVAPFGVIDQADVSAFSASYASQSITPSATADPSGGAFTIGYAGYHYDELTGFWHARHRWYDPEAGRWLTRDPAGYVDGLSLYLYVGANPLALVDPTGLSAFGNYLRDLSDGISFVVDSFPTTPSQYVREARAGAVAVIDYVEPRLDNIAAGAASGAATGGATGAITGSIIPGAGTAAGAGAGALGGAIGGAITGLLGPADAPLSSSIKDGAIGGVIDGATAGFGSKFTTTGKALDTTLDASKAANKLQDVAPTIRSNANASTNAAATAAKPSTAARTTGRYSEAASNHGAYWDSGQRVFPTRRNSGLRGQDLRKQQSTFTERRLVEGVDDGVVRGQAQAAGLTRRITDEGIDELADRGAEKAVQRGIQNYENKCNK